MILYSVRDIMIGFMPPISIANDSAAIRFFRLYAVKHSEVPKNDLEIWRVGTMDEGNGLITAEEPVKLFNGKDIIDEVSDKV